MHTLLKPRRTISLLTATSIVVGNMIGTGIFTSLGFQIGDLRTGFSVMAVWAVGGVCAMCGALAYAELGAALPRSGGEYNFLSRDLSSFGRFSCGMDFGDGWFCRTGCDCGETVRHLPRRYFSGNERALFVARGRLDHDVRSAAGFAVRQLVSKRVHGSESRAYSCHHRRRIFCEKHAAGFIFARER